MAPSRRHRPQRCRSAGRGGSLGGRRRALGAAALDEGDRIGQLLSDRAHVEVGAPIPADEDDLGLSRGRPRPAAGGPRPTWRTTSACAGRPRPTWRTTSSYPPSHPVDGLLLPRRRPPPARRRSASPRRPGVAPPAALDSSPPAGGHPSEIPGFSLLAGGRPPGVLRFSPPAAPPESRSASASPGRHPSGRPDRPRRRPPPIPLRRREPPPPSQAGAVRRRERPRLSAAPTPCARLPPAAAADGILGLGAPPLAAADGSLAHGAPPPADRRRWQSGARSAPADRRRWQSGAGAPPPGPPTPVWGPDRRRLSRRTAVPAAGARPVARRRRVRGIRGSDRAPRRPSAEGTGAGPTDPAERLCVRGPRVEPPAHTPPHDRVSAAVWAGRSLAQHHHAEPERSRPARKPASQLTEAGGRQEGEERRGRPSRGRPHPGLARAPAPGAASADAPTGRPPRAPARIPSPGT